MANASSKARRKDQTKGVFCLEAAHWDGKKDRTSVEPMLRLLEGVKGVRIPYEHHPVATKCELEYWLDKYLKPSYKTHPLLYLAFHGGEAEDGEESGIYLPEGTWVLLPDLAKMMEGRCADRVRLRAKHYFGMELEPMEETDMGTTVFRSRLDENMKRATEAWFADGLKQGRTEGIEQGQKAGIEIGIEQQRSLLRRQVAAKFGPEAAQRIAPLLVGVTEAEELADLAVALLMTRTEAELVAEVERVGAAHRH